MEVTSRTGPSVASAAQRLGVSSSGLTSSTSSLLLHLDGPIGSDPIGSSSGPRQRAHIFINRADLRLPVDLCIRHVHHSGAAWFIHDCSLTHRVCLSDLETGGSSIGRGFVTDCGRPHSGWVSARQKKGPRGAKGGIAGGNQLQRRRASVRHAACIGVSGIKSASMSLSSKSENDRTISVRISWMLMLHRP